MTDYSNASTRRAFLAASALAAISAPVLAQQQGQQRNRQRVRNPDGGPIVIASGNGLQAVGRAHQMGFRVGIVSNGFWATTPAEATACLEPLAGRVEDLSISRDPYHAGGRLEAETGHACAAAETLGPASPTGASTGASTGDRSWRATSACGGSAPRTASS